MSKREEFITFINELKMVSSTISDEQRKGLLRRAVQQHGISVDDAVKILQSSGLVIGEQVDYFKVLGLSISELEDQSESDIAIQVEAAHNKLYRESLSAGGRVRPDGKSEEQWRTILNQARDALKDGQKRCEHLTTLQQDEDEEFIGKPPIPANLDNMALIPAGEFQMGSNDGESFSDEHPTQTVFLDAFYIDKYPVTNAQYMAFVNANPQWSKPRSVTKFISATYHDGYYLSHWNKNNYPEGKADHPIVYISWYAAMAYAQWVGKRLPTEAEWEKAARGGLTDQKYPWGNSIDTGKANCDKNVGSTTPIGNYPANEYDLYDMVGNVWEWCLDEYGFYGSFPRRNLFSEESIIKVTNNFKNIKSSRVLRGGSWITTIQDVGVANRYPNPPRFTNSEIGFRCVKSISP